MFSFLSSTPPNTQTHERENRELGRDLNNQKHNERKIDHSLLSHTNQEGEETNFFFLWFVVSFKEYSQAHESFAI
jgi:hypothetical protein